MFRLATIASELNLTISVSERWSYTVGLLSQMADVPCDFFFGRRKEANAT